jgi:hypothetical protein
LPRQTVFRYLELQVRADVGAAYSVSEVTRVSLALRGSPRVHGLYIGLRG